MEKHEGRMAHREAMMERREAGDWGRRGHERFRFYRGFDSMPYGYRSSSRHYALHERFGGPAMRERAQTLRGKLHIQSSRAGLLTKGHGTRIEVDLPLGAAERR